MTDKQERLKQQLQQIVSNAPCSLKAAVAKEALDCGYDIEAFFTDLLMYGCQSGMIGSLIYYHDTHQFYDAYYDEIEELRCEFEEAFSEPLHVKGDLKNWYAWMAFEETARTISDTFNAEP